MRLVKKALAKGFNGLGYEVHRKSDEHDLFNFNNFVNLTQAYEQSLNESGSQIKTDEIRPKLIARLAGTPPSEAYAIIDSLAKSNNIDGDICEFGVAQGETSALIANEIKTSNKILHLFDSFEGLPKPSEKDQLKDDIFSLGSMEAYAGAMSRPEELVRSRLNDIAFPEEKFVIHKGFVDQVFKNDANLPNKVSFAYVDFDFYEPIKLALEFLHNTAPCGAIFVVDDYDYFSTGAKTAVEEFLEEKNSQSEAYECFVPNTRYGHFAILTRKN